MKTNKLYLLVFMCILNSALSFAQKAEMECLYRLSFLKDTTTNITTDDMMVLRFNKDESLFYSYISYKLDSLLCSDQGPEIQMDILANGSSKYGKRVVSYIILKDFRKKLIDYSDKVGGEHYRYQETMPVFNWKITNEHKKIWDYTCQKATCFFRGRNYVAWFTDEIPINDGPWKFHGLPGLILEVFDINEQYSFVFAGIRRSDSPINMLPRHYIKSTREKYLKAYKNYIKDPVAYISATSGVKISIANSSAVIKKKAKATNYESMERY